MTRAHAVCETSESTSAVVDASARPGDSDEPRPTASSPDVSVPINELIGSIKITPWAAGSDSRRAMKSSSNPKSSPGLARYLGRMKTIFASGQVRRTSAMVETHRVEHVLARREVVVSAAVEYHQGRDRTWQPGGGCVR